MGPDTSRERVVQIYIQTEVWAISGVKLFEVLMPHKDLWKPRNSSKWMDKTNTAKFKAFNSLVEVSIARKYVYRIPHMFFFSFLLNENYSSPQKNTKKNSTMGVQQCARSLTLVPPKMKLPKTKMASSVMFSMRTWTDIRGFRCPGDHLYNIRYGAAGTLGKHRASLLLIVPSLNQERSWRQGGILFEVYYEYFTQNLISNNIHVFSPSLIHWNIRSRSTKKNQTPCLSYILLCYIE